MIKSEMTATSSITRDELDLAIKRTKQQIIDKLTLSSNNSLSELETRMTRVSKKQVKPGFTNYQPRCLAKKNLNLKSQNILKKLQIIFKMSKIFDKLGKF